MSVYGTGRHEICDGGFLVSMITLAVRSSEDSRYCRVSAIPGIARNYTYALQPPIPSGGGGATPQSLLGSHNGYRNLDRLSISLPARVSLRARLTPGRLTSPGKPWAFGVRVSRPHCRFSFPDAPASLAADLRRRPECSPTTLSSPWFRQCA